MTFTGVTKDQLIAGNALNANTDAPSANTPFVLHHGAVSTPSVGTLPVSGLFGITDRGAILGEATSVKQLGGGFSATYTFAFLRAPDGAVTTIDDGSGFMTPRGMDARADKVVGWSFVSGATGWLFSGGAFTPVNYPGSSLTVPAGVDEAGTISGTYYVGDLSMPDSVVTHGFFLRHGAYTSFDFPRAKSTVVQAMNEADQVTGCYTDARGTHGFVRTP